MFDLHMLLTWIFTTAQVKDVGLNCQEEIWKTHVKQSGVHF